MKKVLLLCLFSVLPALAKADMWDTAKSRNAGNYVETYSTTVSSSAATKIIDSTIGIKSATIDVFNNSAYTLWIGSNTSTLMTTGLPVLSSKTYTSDGTYTGDLYGLADSSAAGSINERTIYYLKNDALR